MEVRRRIIFLDREDILNIAISINFSLGGKGKNSFDNEINIENIPLK